MAMTRLLGQAKEELGQHLRAGLFAPALAVCSDILAAAPAALAPRFALATIYAQAGHKTHAVHLLTALAEHMAAAGLPLRALCAQKMLAELGEDCRLQNASLAQRYASTSQVLAKLVTRPPALDWQMPIPVQALPESLDEAAQRAFAMACDFSALPPRADAVAPLPLLSDLAPEALVIVLQNAQRKVFAPSDLLMKQGEVGDSLYFIASGEVVIFTTDPEGANHEIARLQEGALLGEMAVVSADPRSASVVAASDVEAIVVHVQTLATLAINEPAVAQALDRFARERLLKNLLSTSPLFAPFSQEERASLLGLFQGVEYEAGATILRESSEGQGLFVILVGQVEVSSTVNGSAIPLARLGRGEVFGEMSLLAGEATSATVTAVAPTTTLFLPKNDFIRLTEGVPALLTYFATLANQRAGAQSILLGRPND
jgi:CRP-like cAMP-binding protein